MHYTKESITQTTEGLYFSDAFMLELFNRCDQLDRAGLSEESRALLQEFGVVR